jgi:hypothetical protein
MFGMLPCLACLNATAQWSIVPQNPRHVLGLDIFGGSTHIRTTRWEIKTKPGEPEVYAILHVEVHSAFIPKVWFGHITLAKFSWPLGIWDYDSLMPSRKADLEEVGRKMALLFNWTPIRYSNDATPSSIRWLRELNYTWAKVALLLNYQHPLHQSLHHLRSSLRSILPLARIFDRGNFHISFDGIVQFELALPDSGYLGWSVQELNRVFAFNCASGVYSEKGDGRLL